MEELKQLIKEEIGQNNEVVALYKRIAKRQVLILACVAGVLIFVTGVFIWQATRPTNIDKELMKYIERERAALVSERNATRRERDALAALRQVYYKQDSILIKKLDTLNKRYENLLSISNLTSQQIKDYFSTLGN
jgi:hypothetical protein